VYKYAQYINANWKGNRIKRSQLGKPKLALSLMNIYMFAGKIATSKAMMPKEAYLEVKGKQSAIPKTISEKPQIAFSKLGFGKKGGMIFKYNLGFLK